MFSDPARRRRIAGLTALATAAAAVATLTIGASPALADNAPQQTCGTIQPGPCTETDHFTSENGWQSPLGSSSNPTNCPSWVTDDYVLLTMSGKGVEHVTVNKAQDFWSTSTFTGTGTATFYPASSLADIVTDDQGNITSVNVVGPADTTVSGHLTNWFGASGNNKNAVFHGTINLIGSDLAGNPVAVHDVQHMSWTGTQVPFVDMPHLAFNDLTC